ncbi:MAG: hypothetical protein ACR2I2_08895 [Bryobacteraceae bacterium]
MPLASAQIGLGLSPMRLEVKMEPGMQRSGVLTLSSDSKDKIRARAEALDFLIDRNQTPQFEPRLPSESEFSCRDWVTINPVETEINAGKQVNVRYTIRVPADAGSSRGYHCAIGFTTLPTDAQIGATGIRTAVQFVSALYITAGRPGIEGEFKQLRLVHGNPGDETRWVGEVTLQNQGLTQFRPIGELSVLDAGGKVLESVPLTPLPALPRREQRYLVHFTRDFAPGDYALRARADFGGSAIEESTAVVHAEP